VITISKQFVGPPGTGNGGYVCGSLAAHLSGPAEITLRQPCPLEVPLAVQRDGDSVTLTHGESVIAIGRPQLPDVKAPEPISFDQAVEASQLFSGHHHHPVPGCFVCGTDHPEGMGLRLFAGPVGGVEDRVATPWIPHQNHTDAAGIIPDEIIWSALDCPGVFAVGVGGTSPMLLGRLNAQIFGRPSVGDACVVQGWKVGVDGRKNFTGTAIYGVEGQLLAVASGVWISVDSP
jgi:hypothetical protein